MKLKVDWNKMYKSSAPWELSPPPHIKDFVRYLRKDDVVLDIGCGSGRDCVFLAKADYRIIGIDVSAEAIKKAKLNAQKEKLNIHYDVGMAEKLPFGNSFFDKIYSGFVLQSTDIEKVTREMVRVLKSGGVAFIATLLNTEWADGKIEHYYPVDKILKLFKRDFKILKQKEYGSLDRKPKPHIHRTLLLVMQKK
jgi:ubiquinone/menaquinone biosynthesis C-methylase UbiE